MPCLACPALHLVGGLRDMRPRMPFVEHDDRPTVKQALGGVGPRFAGDPLRVQPGPFHRRVDQRGQQFLRCVAVVKDDQRRITCDGRQAIPHRGVHAVAGVFAQLGDQRLQPLVADVVAVEVRAVVRRRGD